MEWPGLLHRWGVEHLKGPFHGKRIKQLFLFGAQNARIFHAKLNFLN